MHSFDIFNGLIMGVGTFSMFFLAYAYSLTKKKDEEIKKDNLKVKLIIALVISLIVGGASAYLEGEHYTKGNYAGEKCDKTLPICQNEPTYRLFYGWNSGSKYYCEEHYSEGLMFYELSTTSSSSNSKNKKCGVCGDTFTDSANKRSISRTHMCVSCYRNFKPAYDAVNN